MTPLDIPEISNQEPRATDIITETDEDSPDNPNNVNHVEVATLKIEDLEELPEQIDEESQKIRDAFCLCC